MKSLSWGQSKEHTLLIVSSTTLPSLYAQIWTVAPWRLEEEGREAGGTLISKEDIEELPLLCIVLPRSLLSLPSVLFGPSFLGLPPRFLVLEKYMT